MSSNKLELNKILSSFKKKILEEADTLIRERAVQARLNVYLILHQLVCSDCKKIIDEGLKKHNYEL